MRVVDIVKQVDELKQKIAVKKAMIGFLKTRYMGRDGLSPQSTIQYERSTVTEDIVHECVMDLEKEVDREEKLLKATLEGETK